MSPDSKTSRFNEILKAEGLNASLPYAIFSSKSELLAANSRMFQILALDEDSIALPLPIKDSEDKWIFHNDSMAGPAILKDLLNKNSENEFIVAQAEQRSYKLQSRWSAKHKVSIVIAELIRRGDLLEDRESRQLLFRVISHEIRTSVQVLKGYMQMIQFDEGVIEDRMWGSLERLEKVVDMLRDLKTELEVEPQRNADKKKAS